MYLGYLKVLILAFSLFSFVGSSLATSTELDLAGPSDLQSKELFSRPSDSLKLEDN